MAFKDFIPLIGSGLSTITQAIQGRKAAKEAKRQFNYMNQRLPTNMIIGVNPDGSPIFSSMAISNANRDSAMMQNAAQQLALSQYYENRNFQYQAFLENRAHQEDYSAMVDRMRAAGFNPYSSTSPFSPQQSQLPASGGAALPSPPTMASGYQGLSSLGSILGAEAQQAAVTSNSVGNLLNAFLNSAVSEIGKSKVRNLNANSSSLELDTSIRDSARSAIEDSFNLQNDLTRAQRNLLLQEEIEKKLVNANLPAQLTATLASTWSDVLSNETAVKKMLAEVSYIDKSTGLLSVNEKKLLKEIDEINSRIAVNYAQANNLKASTLNISSLTPIMAALYSQQADLYGSQRQLNHQLTLGHYADNKFKGRPLSKQQFLWKESNYGNPRNDRERASLDLYNESLTNDEYKQYFDTNSLNYSFGSHSDPFDLFKYLKTKPTIKGFR